LSFVDKFWPKLIHQIDPRHWEDGHRIGYCSGAGKQGIEKMHFFEQENDNV
jgi:hypothetical protein